MDWLNELLADIPADLHWSTKRRMAILARWPLAKQAEAQADAAIGKDDLVKQMATEIGQIKASIPSGAEESLMVVACSPWQIRKALNTLGLRLQVEDAIEQSEVQEVKDGWEFATSFRSDDPFVLGIAQAIGKDEAEVAEIIRYARTL